MTQEEMLELVSRLTILEFKMFKKMVNTLCRNGIARNTAMSMLCNALYEKEQRRMAYSR